MVKAGRKVYAKIPMTPLESFTSAEELRQSLLDIVEGSEADASASEQIIAQAADLVYYRFCQSSPEEYAASRERWGYRRFSTAEMRRRMVAEDYELIFHEPYPGDDKIEEVYRRLWQSSVERDGGVSRVVKMSATGMGAEIAFQDGMCLENMGDWPRLSGELGEDVWHGGGSGACRSWFVAPQGILPEGIRASGRCARAALLGIVIEAENGVRYPIMMTLYQLKPGEPWWIAAFGRMNADPSQPIVEY
ncbi:MAG: hypothetical protein R3B57_12935 [Phycisphaerales bacterium]